MVSDFFQLIFMKVIITNDSLDSLLSIQISTNGGQSYSTYSVSSLKDGLTFDCSPKDLKVICDVNTLKYIQVLADGEKASSSDIDLSNYIKIKDIYVDLYENPYFNKSLTEEEINKLNELDRALYEHRNDQYYCCGKDFDPYYWSHSLALARPNTSDEFNLDYNFTNTWTSKEEIINGSNKYYNYYTINSVPFESDRGLDFDLRVRSNDGYLWDGYNFFTNARVHFIKHF